MVLDTYHDGVTIWDPPEPQESDTQYPVPSQNYVIIEISSR